MSPRLGVLLLLAPLTLGACTSSSTPVTTPQTSETGSATSESGGTSPDPSIVLPPDGLPATGKAVAAVTLLNQLEVAPEITRGYKRSLFGEWSDDNSNACNTRKEVLLRDAIAKPARSPRCGLTGGRWQSPYDDRTVLSAQDMDIDHVVAVAEAWRSGAATWSPPTRAAFYNDLGYRPSLLAVTRESNMDKGDQAPGEWLPSNVGYRCRFVADWVAIKWRWSLAIDKREKADLAMLLRDCPGATAAMPPLARVTAG